MCIEKNTFVIMTNLVYLDLSLSKIWILKSNCFNGLNNLKRLNLNFCNINHIEEDAFSSCLANLETLVLSHNKLKLVETYHFKSLFNLKQLNLSNNNLELVKYGSFDCLKNLISLDLSSNQKLNSIKADIFQNLVNLRQLRLDDILKDYLNENKNDLQQDSNIKLKVDFISFENDLNNNFLS